jgi:hypothetical protein
MPIKATKKAASEEAAQIILVQFCISLFLSVDIDFGFQVSAKRFSATPC